MDFNVDNFSSTLPYASEKMLVVFMTKPDCEPCEKMKPIVKSVASKLANRGIIFGQVDKFNCPTIVRSLGCDLFPAFVCLKQSKIVAKTSGSRSENKLEKWVVDQFENAE